MTTRRVVLTRPAHTRKPYRAETPPVGSHVSTPTNTPTGPTSEHTTTTNVVSVVCEGGGSRVHAHANQATDFLDRLKQLPEKERKTVLDSLLLELQLSADTRPDRDVGMWAEAVHRELTRRLGSMDGGLVGPMVVRKTVAVGTSWKPVDSFMRSSRLNELTVTERQRAYYLLAELLVRHARAVARRSGVPLSPKLVANCTVNLPGLFEDAFPGYLNAGLAKVVARSPERTAV